MTLFTALNIITTKKQKGGSIMPSIFDSFTTKIKKEVKTKLITAAEGLLSKTTKISEIKLDTPENILQTITNISMQLLGITNKSFLVPGLQTPGLLDASPSAASQNLTLKTTGALLKNLKDAEKTFKNLPPEKINGTHRFETLTYLNLLISHLTNLFKTMANCKKKCPLTSDYKLKRDLRAKITNCLNSLIDFNDKTPSYLTNKHIIEHFYQQYGQNRIQVRALTGQELKDMAKKNLTKYYNSWNLKPSNAKTPKFYSSKDAKAIFNALISQNTTIKLSDNSKLNLNKANKPFNPSTKIENDPLDFTYDEWLEIYNTLNETIIKEIAEQRAVTLDFTTEPRTLQIKDITTKISTLAEKTIHTLNSLPGKDLTDNLYEIFDYTNQSAAKKPTLNNVRKLTSRLLTKLIKKTSDLKKLKTQVERKYPYLKIKTTEEASDQNEKMKTLLQYNLLYPYPTVYEIAYGPDKSEKLPNVTDKQINLKEFKNSLLTLTKNICDTTNDNSTEKQSNLAKLNLAINLYLELANKWETQVKDLSKQLDTTRLEKNDDNLITATTFITTNKKIISANPILRNLAKKIKALQLTPFGKKTNKLHEYCAKLVAGVKLINNSPTNNTQTTPPLKTENNIQARVTSEKTLDKYNTIQDFYLSNSHTIKQYPSYYANFKQLLKPMPLNDSLWALSNNEKFNDIFKQFEVYRTNSHKHPELYNKTYEKDKEFLQTILKLPLIANTTQLKTKAQSLLKLTEKFKTQYSGTPEDYLELTQKIDKLRNQVNNAFYSDMKSYKEKTYTTKRAAMPNAKADKMGALLDAIDTTITPASDNLENYKKFVEILTSK